MRIHGKQQTFGGGHNQADDAEKRQQAFRQNKQLGQEVQGTVLKPWGEKTPGQVWIDVGGLALTAQLPFEAWPGQRLLLRIESLEPEILLKFIKQVYGASAAVQVQAYTSLRNRFQSSWQTFFQALLSGDSPSTSPNSLTNGLEAATPTHPEGIEGLIAWANLAKLIASLEGGASPKFGRGLAGLAGPQAPAMAAAEQKRHLFGDPPTEPTIEPLVQIGEPFPAWLVNVGESLVASLYKIWSNNFLNSLPDQTKMELGELNAMQFSSVKSLESKGVRAWSHIPWASPSGREQELLIMRPQGQRLEQVLISGIWPELGTVFINALCLNGQISCRVHVQNLCSFEQTLQILNLPGLGQTIQQIAQKHALPSETSKKLAARSITCLELKQCSADTIPAILLRL